MRPSHRPRPSTPGHEVEDGAPRWKCIRSATSLRYARALNFTRAAEQCHVTQPALTRAIQKLEDELGGLLFRRERHLTHLTDLGRLIQPQLEQIWKTEAAKTTAKSFLKLDNAPLNLGVMCTIGPLRGIGFVTDFWRSNQGIEITLRQSVPQKAW